MLCYDTDYKLIDAGFILALNTDCKGNNNPPENNLLKVGTNIRASLTEHVLMQVHQL